MDSRSRVPGPEDCFFYDSAYAVRPEEIQELYRFTHWGRSRSIEQIARMLQGSSMCFSVRREGKLIAFCRILTDFVFRGSLWDILVHPDFQGQGLGTALIHYALDHPAIRDIPLITTYTSDLEPFLEKFGFRAGEGTMKLLRCPIEYS